MIRNLTNAPHYTWGHACDGWRLVDRDDLSVIRERVPPGAGEALHRHQRAEQVFIVLSGELLIEVESVAATLRAGDSLEVRPGSAHRVSNPGGIDVWFLVVSAPSTRGDRQNLDDNRVFG
jgi:mannose-6-phosphate isomerase-like protein (cupin superfamily)